MHILASFLSLGVWFSYNTIHSVLEWLDVARTLTVHNNTTHCLYSALYYVDDDAERIGDSIVCEPFAQIMYERPQARFGSRRYCVVSDSKEKLAKQLFKNTFRALVSKDIDVLLCNRLSVEDIHGRIALQTGTEQYLVAPLLALAHNVLDMSIRKRIKKTNILITQNPYKDRIAHVRRGDGLSDGEKQFLVHRLPKVQQSLSALLKRTIPDSGVPRIAVVASGGGFRAMFAFTGFLLGLERAGLLDTTTYLAALSGSTWATGAWFASGMPLDVFAQHLIKSASRGITDIDASEVQAIMDRLLVKFAYGRPLSFVDVFGALITAVVMNDFGDERYTATLSDQITRLEDGAYPMPIYTAVDGSAAAHSQYRWYEFTPYEFGGSWLKHYVPMWAFGRSFVHGQSCSSDPEVSLGYMCGVCGSAFAASVTEIWNEFLLQYKDVHPLMPTIRTLLTNVVGDERITRAEEYNFTAGLDTSPVQHDEYIQLVDGGFDFTLPYPTVSGEREERKTDILIFMDTSGEVKDAYTDPRRSMVQLFNAQAYAKEHGLKFPPIEVRDPRIIQVFKDEHDPLCPLVIWMPLINDKSLLEEYLQKDEFKRFEVLRDFDPAQCMESGFCSTYNFLYKPEEAELLVRLGEFNVLASKEKIVEAIAQVLF